MADNKKIDFILKKMKNACNMRKILFVSVDKKMISLIMNSILKMSWFVHNFVQNKHMVPIVYTLVHSYLDF